MCTFLLTGGRSGNMASCEPCNMSTGFKGYVWFHHLSFFFFFFLPQECQHPRQALLLPLDASRKKKAWSRAHLRPWATGKGGETEPSLWSAETNNCVTSPPMKSIFWGFAVCQELGKHHFLDFTTTEGNWRTGKLSKATQPESSRAKM